MGKFAYVTLVARDKYVDGAVCLAKTLKETSRYPLIAMVCEVSPEGIARLGAAGIACRNVEKITSVNAGIGHNTPRLEDFTYTYTKLHAFGYEEYERIVFIDADTIVVKSMDHLFVEVKTNFAACAQTPYFEHLFNSGMMIFKPSRALYEDLISKKDVLPTVDGGDQGFLNEYFKDWEKLDIKYNAGKRIYSERREEWDRMDHHVIHFVGGKPWLGGEKGYEELEKLWVDAYHR